MTYDILHRKIITHAEAFKFDMVNYVFTAWLHDHLYLTPEAIGHTRMQWELDSLALILTDSTWQVISRKLSMLERKE